MGSKSFEERLEVVLGDRKIHPWGKRLGMTRGTIQRLKEGSFPDPAKLMPACRVENLSLSWLLFGIGTPYLIQVAVDPGDAMDRLDVLLTDESWSILIAHTDSNWIPVLHQPAELLLPGGSTLQYRVVQIITGAVKGCEVRLIDRLSRESKSKVESIELGERDWRRLAGGYMGPVELFLKQPVAGHGLFKESEPLLFSLGEVGEEPPAYDVQTAAEREATTIISKLDRADRDAALRMLRGLAAKDSSP